jgi:hypothetical protein
MTPEEMELWRWMVEEMTSAFVMGCIILAIGMGCISVKKIFNKEQGK